MFETLTRYSYSSVKMDSTTLLISGIIGLVAGLVALIAQWRMYTKAGKHGWAVLIPIYNVWVLYEIICDRGTAMFRLLIPIYNIYWSIKSIIKLAHAYGKGTGFGILMLFFPPICYLILGFGSAEYEGPQDM